MAYRIWYKKEHTCRNFKEKDLKDKTLQMIYNTKEKFEQILKEILRLN